MSAGIFKVVDQDSDVAVLFDQKHAVKVVSDCNRQFKVDDMPYDILFWTEMNNRPGWRFMSWLEVD